MATPTSFDPLLTLAYTLHSTPGSHAVLLGAGGSISAGVLSAWGIQVELINAIAAVRGEPAPDDPGAWFQEHVGKPLRYDVLLEELAPTPIERQAALKPFFEPTPADIEANNKQPAAGHRALAQLVAGGAIRVIVTLNFDHLVETALREAGVNPVIVSTDDDARGLQPLHTISALVIHAHGDYLNPAAMRNTQQELEQYAPEMERLLGRVFEDHALLAVGWSATWDTALRALIASHLRRYWTSYWIEPGALSPEAETTRALAGMIQVTGAADETLNQLAAAVAVLEQSQGRHPLSMPIAVTTAKQALSGRYTPVQLHDVIKDEINALQALPDLNSTGRRQAPDAAMHLRLAESTSVPAALIATATYWGSDRTDAWWLPEIEKLARAPRNVDGDAIRIRMQNLPATHLLYAACIAAIGASRLELVHHLLNGLMTTDNRGRRVQVAQWCDPDQVHGAVRNGAGFVYDHLRALFVGQLGFGPQGYDEACELFEFLRLLSHLDQLVDLEPLYSRLVDAEKQLDDAKTQLTLGYLGTDEQSAEARESLAAADRTLGVAQRALADRAAARRSHVRITRNEEAGALRTVLGQQLLNELADAGDQHRLVTAGFGGGDAERLRLHLSAIDLAFGVLGHRASSDALVAAGAAGVLIEDFWLDSLRSNAT